MRTRPTELGRQFRTLIIVIMLACGSWACPNLPAMQPDIPKPLTGAIRFTVRVPGAKQVFLVGSFNGWAKDTMPMTLIDGSSLWSVDVPLAEGEHTFMYLIDGIQWMTPTQAEDFVTDDFGQLNGVVIVR